jgi:hypothetical protein
MKITIEIELDYLETVPFVGEHLSLGDLNSSAGCDLDAKVISVETRTAKDKKAGILKLKKLREETGASLKDSLEALKSCEWDLPRAEEILRVAGTIWSVRPTRPQAQPGDNRRTHRPHLLRRAHVPIKKIEYSKGDLCTKALAILEAGWQTENLRDLWWSKSQWYDTTHDSLCHERSVDEIPMEELDLLWESWFKAIPLPEEMRADMVSIWEDSEDNEVLWKW